jgi:Flp pilus assembly protein TadG
MRHACKRAQPFFRRGGATLELAIVLPVLCLLFVLTLDFARVFYYSVAVTSCARNGALYASSGSGAALDSEGIKTHALMESSRLDAKQLTITATRDHATTPTLVQVTVAYPFSTITRFPGVPTSILLTRSVWVQVAPDMPASK